MLKHRGSCLGLSRVTFCLLSSFSLIAQAPRGCFRLSCVYKPPTLTHIWMVSDSLHSYFLRKFVFRFKIYNYTQIFSYLDFYVSFLMWTFLGEIQGVVVIPHGGKGSSRRRNVCSSVSNSFFWGNMRYIKSDASNASNQNTRCIKFNTGCWIIWINSIINCKNISKKPLLRVEIVFAKSSFRTSLLSITLCVALLNTLIFLLSQGQAQ